jgi:hypothetical protein
MSSGRWVGPWERITHALRERVRAIQAVDDRALKSVLAALRSRPPPSPAACRSSDRGGPAACRDAHELPDTPIPAQVLPRLLQVCAGAGAAGARRPVRVVQLLAPLLLPPGHAAPPGPALPRHQHRQPHKRRHGEDAVCGVPRAALRLGPPHAHNGAAGERGLPAPRLLPFAAILLQRCCSCRRRMAPHSGTCACA